MILLAIYLFGLACAGRIPESEIHVTGTLYEYDYRSLVDNWIVQTSEMGSSGIRLNAKVQVTLSSSSDMAFLQIVDATIQNALLSAGILISQAPWEQFPELSEYPLLFRLRNGTLVEIFPHPEDREEIVNIKRGIVSTFQVRVEGCEGRLFVEETDVLGTCKTEVRESIADDDGNLVILKKKATEECEGRPVLTILPLSDSQEAKFVYGSVLSRYIVTASGVIKSATIEQREIFSPLSKDAGTVLTQIQQTFILTNTTEHHETGSYPVVAGKSPVFNYFRQPSEQDSGCLPFASDLIDLMAESVPHDIPHLFIELIEVMKKCNISQLETLNETFVKCQKEDAPSGTPESEAAKNETEKHTFFLDALAYVGTEPAMELISAIIVTDNCLSSSRKGELSLSLSFLPVWTAHPCIVLKYALVIAEAKPMNMTPTLVLGAIINKVLEMPNCLCMENVSKAIDFLTTKLETNLNKLPQDFSPQDEELRNHSWPRPVEIWENAVHAIKGLGNAGTPKTIHLLSTIVNDKRLQIEGRAAAIYALKSASRRSPLLVRSVAKTIALNKDEEQEIRVAAFVTFMHTLTPDVPFPVEEFFHLIYAFTTEDNNYLKSFVCTYLMALSRSDDPSLYTQSAAAIYYLKQTGLFLTCPSVDDRGYFSSKATRGYVSLADAPLPRSLPRDVMGVGFSLDVLSTDAGWVPRAAYGKLTTNLFGFDIDMFEIGVRGTGIERLIQHLFGPTGYLRKGTRNMGTSNLDRGSDDCEFDIDLSQENISASVNFKFLSQEIGWKHVEQGNIMRSLYARPSLTKLRETITDVIFGKFDFQDVVDITHRLADYFHYAWEGKLPIWHGKINITKTARLLDINRIIPTILGMPLNLTAKAAGHLQLDSEGEVCYHTLPLTEQVLQLLYAPSRDLDTDKIEAWGEISPKFSVWSEVNLTLDAIKFQPKLVARANITSNFTQRVNITLDDEWKLNVKILEMPDNETMILNASYTQFAEVGNKSITLGVEKRNETMLYDPVGMDLLKLTLRSDISYANSTDVDQGPFFPLSGPANLALTLRRDVNLEMIEIRFYNTSENSLDEGRFDIEVESVGTEAGITGFSEWWIDSTVVPPRKGVKVDFVSFPVNFTSMFFGNTKKRMDIEGSMELVTEVSNTTVNVKFDRSHFRGVMNRVRHSPEPWDLPYPPLKEPIITIPEFSLQVDGSLANNSEGYTSIMLLMEGSDKPQWLRANYTVRKLMVNVSAQSSLFNHTNFFYILPYPIKSPICHVFDGSLTHTITFDGMKLEQTLNPECEYVLARHRHVNDTFAVTRKGKDVNVYIDGTIYTLTEDHTKFKENKTFKALPYKQKHVIHVREVETNGHKYVRLSAWAGVDIYYSGGDIQLAVNGFFINQTAGLCGNANYDSSYEDEMVLPNITKVASSVDEFTHGWSQCCEKPSRDIPLPTACAPNQSDYEVCDRFFWGALTEAHVHVGVYAFYNACLYDVQFCHNPLPSIQAYIRAAHAKQIDVSGCQYGKWSIWSTCEDSTQYRTRGVIENPFSEVCSLQRESRPCKRLGSCIGDKAHIYRIVTNKVCKSLHRFPTCPEGCQVTYENQLTEFRCVRTEEETEKFGNVSPIIDSYPLVTSCEFEE